MVTDLPTSPAELSAIFRHMADMLDELHARREGRWKEPGSHPLDTLIESISGPILDDVEPPSAGTIALILADEPESADFTTTQAKLRTTDQLTRDRVLDDLRAHPRSTAGQVAARLKIPVKDALAELVRTGQVEGAGKTRGRRYWVREGDSA